MAQILISCLANTLEQSGKTTVLQLSQEILRLTDLGSLNCGEGNCVDDIID